MIRVCSCIAFGAVLGISLLAAAAAAASQFADMNLFQEKQLDPRVQPHI